MKFYKTYGKHILFISFTFLVTSIIFFINTFKNGMYTQQEINVIQVSNMIIAVIFFITFTLKKNANTISKINTLLFRIVSTLAIKIIALSGLIVIIYFATSTEVLAHTKFFVLGFFVFYSLLESFLLFTPK